VSPAHDTRIRLLGAAMACVERWGLAKTSIEDVANEAGLSRATVYRHFPGGREQLISEMVTWEVANFFTRIEAVVAAAPDLTTKLVDGLVFGHAAIHEHRLLQRVLSSEPEALLEELSSSSLLVLGVVRSYVLELLRGETLQVGVDPTMAADYLARLYLSYLGSHGQWNLVDRTEVARLVHTQFVAGILANRQSG